jgi:predicted amidohydrolase
MRLARARGADVAHFPEAALPGYAGADVEGYSSLDWRVLEECTHRIIELARDLGLWILLGSIHRLTGPHKPHNSVYVVSDRGEVVDRYDKMFCSGDPGGQIGDLAHFTPGDHFSVFEINEIRCGVMICYDFRFPELYREYKRRDVELLFHSFHAGAAKPDWVREQAAYIGGHRRLNPGSTLPGITMPATTQSMAANNYMWISASNSAARESAWPAFFVRPDGVVTGRLRRNVPGVLISSVDTDESVYDSTIAWRERAMSGVLHSGTTARDERSEDRTRL